MQLNLICAGAASSVGTYNLILCCGLGMLHQNKSQLNLITPERSSTADFTFSHVPGLEFSNRATQSLARLFTDCCSPDHLKRHPTAPESVILSFSLQLPASTLVPRNKITIIWLTSSSLPHNRESVPSICLLFFATLDVCLPLAGFSEKARWRTWYPPTAGSWTHSHLESLRSAV